jgi:cobalt-zinc-cadmium efflux system outer membrane protein
MKRSIGILLLGLSCQAFAGGPGQPLTLQEALALLRAQNPTLASARAHLAAVQASETTAKLRPNPVLSLANEDFNVFNPSKFDIANGQEFTDNVAFLMERGHKRQRRMEDAQLTTLVAGHTYRDNQRQLELLLKTAFVGMLQAKAAFKLAQENLSDYSRTLEANQLRLQSGDISQTEFDRIKVEEARFQTDLLNAELALAQTRMQLATLLAVQEQSSLDIQGTLDRPALSLDAVKLRAAALATRPDYLAAVEGVRKAQADLALANANGATDVTLAPEYKRNGPDNTLGFTVQFPLRVFDRNQGEKLRTSRELEASRFAESAARQQVISDVDQSFAAFQTALRRADLYSTDYLQRARLVRDRTEFSYRNGATNLLDYLDAVRSYRDVDLAAIAADAQLLLAVHQLSFATATELLP